MVALSPLQVIDSNEPQVPHPTDNNKSSQEQVQLLLQLHDKHMLYVQPSTAQDPAHVLPDNVNIAEQNPEQNNVDGSPGHPQHELPPLDPELFELLDPELFELLDPELFELLELEDELTQQQVPALLDALLPLFDDELLAAEGF
jgi:hypothetical protein